MYKIKQIPEDFMVWEIPKYDIDDNGEYAYFWLRKKNLNTVDAIKKIAFKLKIPIKNVGFAGNKDKNAVTEQVISIRGIKKERIEGVNFPGMEITYIGQGIKPISLGDLEGNRFRITVRDLKDKYFVKSLNKIPNFFGEQRFSKNNIGIGKALVLKNFKKAVDLIDLRYVKEYLDDNLGDYVGALRQIPLKLRRLYIHSYQSFLWNKSIEEFLKTKPFKNEKIPLIGFGIELENNKVSSIIRKIMSKEGIVQRDFVISQIPELSSEGAVRDLFIKPGNLKVIKGMDEINKERQKAVVCFTLPKGSYATVVISYLFENQ